MTVEAWPSRICDHAKDETTLCGCVALVDDNAEVMKSACYAMAAVEFYL